jgi:hypothetical protein
MRVEGGPPIERSPFLFPSEKFGSSRAARYLLPLRQKFVHSFEENCIHKNEGSSALTSLDLSPTCSDALRAATASNNPGFIVACRAATATGATEQFDPQRYSAYRYQTPTTRRLPVYRSPIRPWNERGRRIFKSQLKM